MDATPPWIVNLIPEQEELVDVGNVTISFNVTDASEPIYCNITINGTVNNSAPIQVSNGTNYTYNVTDMEEGLYFWNVTCIDNANNTNTSNTWNFTVSAGDLWINWTFITFNDTSPVEGYNVTINATIINPGGDADNITVQFWDNHPDLNGTQINGNITRNYTADTNTTIYVNWTVSLGIHEIYVFIDIFNEFSETNETNNNASRNITISSWHVIYGENVGDLVLADNETFRAFSWQVLNVTGGNVYAVDADSNVKWSSLEAIAKNTVGGRFMNDFEDIDAKLNSSDYPDSVNISFTSDGEILQNTTFYVYTNTITEVPIINSTNNTQFVTGILWDTSDDSNGQYNGSEDLVFASKINQDKISRYGTYDYEIRIPSELKKYIGPDTLSVTFYVELR